MKTFIIAEAGVNHNGSIDLAIRLIDAAADAGADAVKFQTFRSSDLASQSAGKAAYQVRTTEAGENQLEMLKKLELSAENHRHLMKYCRDRNIQFLSTPFEAESLRFLTSELGLKTIKLSSGDLTNAPFLLEAAQCSEQLILSTGMATLAEIEAALGVLAYGFIRKDVPPAEPDAFQNAYYSESGRDALLRRVSILHCTTEYPAPPAEVNLRAMDTLSTAFGLATGYSDHTVGIHIPVAAVARGAKIIEKHFTLDRNLPGPDHRASLEPEELHAMVSVIRDIELSLGDGIKRPTQSELRNRNAARKSLVVARSTAEGSPLRLVCKRPGTGLSPFDFWRWEGKPAQRAYLEDELLEE